MLRKINLLFFLFGSLLSFSQKKETITIKKQGEIFFYRTGEFKDSLITKNKSDVFYIEISDDLKTITEIKLSNATFLKTNDDKRFKLLYTKGMKYRMVYLKEAPEDLNSMDTIISAQISPDGASSNSNKDIVIELWDTQANKRILKNVFVYSEN
jgi:hypothetical protein